jgi:hypothetical protein
VPLDAAAASMRRFGERVMPRFQGAVTR